MHIKNIKNNHLQKTYESNINIFTKKKDLSAEYLTNYSRYNIPDFFLVYFLLL